MTFWNHLKPATHPPKASAVDMRQDEKAIQLTWDDGQVTRVGAQALRQNCPCAGCVDEFTGKRTLNPETIRADITFNKMSPVGNYALSFAFSDGHSTGIFTWETLRRLSEAFPIN